MMRTHQGIVAPVEWATASRSRPGEVAMGDCAIVHAIPNGALLGVIDGLGHGPAAASAAAAAIRALKRYAERPISELLALCHELLRGTRGVVMSLAEIDSARRILTWVGVGNVEAVIVQEDYTVDFKPQRLIPQPGILGYRLPRPRPVDIPLDPGMTAVFATDGVDSRFMQELRPVGPPNRIAERILAAHAREDDDALVLVARYLGTQV